MKIIIPIKERTYKKALQQVKRSLKANGVEIWFDEIDEPSEIKKLIKSAGRRPVIAVCRSPKEGGSYKGSERDRMEILKVAVNAGAKYVDIGLHTHAALRRSLSELCKKKRAKMILSHHNWKSTPSNSSLKALFEKMRKVKERPDLIKIATTIRKWSDATTLFELARYASHEGVPFIITAMGKHSLIARVGCALLGGFLTYAAIDEKSRTAPGQPTYNELRQLGM